MYKLLIVDDEAATRQGIQQYLPWQTLHVSEVRLAAGGEEAIKICSEFTPDIVISDIRMPDMNGIELCSTIRELLPLCRLIFISAYADKDYFKEAIRLEAVSYVEKPINLSELQAAVSRATAQLDELFYREKKTKQHTVSLPILQELTILNILSGYISEPVETVLEGAQLFQNGERWFRVLFFKNSQPAARRESWDEALHALAQRLDGQAASVTAIKDPAQAIVVLASQNKAHLQNTAPLWARLQQAVSVWNENGQHLFCAVGQLEEGCQRIAASYRSAVLTLQKLFFTGYGATLFYMDEPEAQVPDEASLLQNFKELVASRNLGGTLAELDTLHATLRQMSAAPVTFIKNIYIHLGYLLAPQQDKALAQDEAGSERQYSWFKILEYNTLAEIHSYITALATQVLSTPDYSSLVCAAVKLIETQYADEDLKIGGIAQQVFVTPSYLSRVFKEETGQTVGEYITHVRMEHAKRLLADHRLKLYHVAMMVGYPNPSYFAKVFKKEAGLMPSEYREQLR